MNDRRRVEAVCTLGVVTIDELRAARLSRGTIRWMVQRGELERVFRGVFACSWLPQTWEHRAMRVLRWLGPHAALSHRSAASLHQLDGFQTRPGQIEVSVPHRRFNQIRLGVTPAGYRVHRSRVPFETVEIDNLRVVELKRTLIDLAGTVEVAALDGALDAAMRKTPGFDGEVERAIGTRRRGRQGVSSLLELIEDRGGVHTDSPLENQVFRKVRARGLPRPRHQFSLSDEKGFISRADFVWLEHRVALHVDGWAFHRQRHQFERDREIASRLAGIGWVSVWVTSKMLKTNAWLDTLARTLTERNPQRSLF
ncbi:MAG: type IV toxin-antitoxin system AbiEi family antitoxin domain-containing protein [Myxococcota bacterium]